jgi:hypothetical protein
MDTVRKFSGPLASAALQAGESRYKESDISDAKAAAWGAIRYLISYQVTKMIGRSDGILFESAVAGALQIAAKSSIDEYGDDGNAMTFASGFVQQALSKMIQTRVGEGMALPGQDDYRPAYTPNYNQQDTTARNI